MHSSYQFQSVLELTSWSVHEMPLYGVDAPWTRHIVGFANVLGLAQVSFAIVMFDHERRCGASANQCVFQLVGASGRHPAVESLWSKWKALNEVNQELDITAHFHQAQWARLAVAAVPA